MTPETNDLLNRQATPRERVEDAVRHAAHLSHEARLLKSLAADALEDGAHAVKRSVRQAKARALDGRDGLAYRIKRQPFAAIAIAFSIGAMIGLFTGYAGGRRRSREE
jgi:ElaB/YqjD/DUF883 family membrane-anchored ribosome-binding protein